MFDKVDTELKEITRKYDYYHKYNRYMNICVCVGVGVKFIRANIFENI